MCTYGIMYTCTHNLNTICPQHHADGRGIKMHTSYRKNNHNWSFSYILFRFFFGLNTTIDFYVATTSYLELCPIVKVISIRCSYFCFFFFFLYTLQQIKIQGPVVQSIVSLTSSWRVIFVNCFSRFNIQYSDIFCRKMWVAAKATHIFFNKKYQHICVSLDVNFNKSLTNDVVSFEQLGPVKLDFYWK